MPSPSTSSSSSSRSPPPSSSTPPPHPRCLGLLFGEQQGRVVRVLETVEIASTTDEEGKTVIQTEPMELDMKLFSEAYSDYECLGWYSCASAIHPDDLTLHRQMTKYNERPLFVLLDPLIAASSPELRSLPVTIYEEVVHVAGEKSRSEFVTAPYTLQADEAERITVTYCAKAANQEETGSAVVSHYSTLLKAVSSLSARIRVLHQFLQDVQSGKVDIRAQGDQQLLRDIKGLCNRLPVVNKDAFRGQLLSEYNDALLVTYLSSLTKSAQLLADVQEKSALVYGNGTSRDEGQGMGMMGRGGRGHMDDDFHAVPSHGRPTRSGRGIMGNIMGSLGMHMS